MTQDNRGKHTAGVDGIKSLKPAQRLAVAENLEALPTGKPARRIWIPKPGKNEQRPLSIPTLYDRARQALVKQAMEPEWEAKFEPNSYGFRPGRSVHDAIGAIFTAINKQPKYVLDADIAKCFDAVDQEKLMDLIAEEISDGRVLGLIRRILRSGVLEAGYWQPPLTGVPQGGVASPLWSNIFLTPFDRAMTEAGYCLTRWADDFVVLCTTRAEAEAALRFAERFLHEQLGVALHPQKTRIVPMRQGFEFLGYKVQRGKGFQLPAWKRHRKQTNRMNLYAIPREKSVKRFRDQIRGLTRRNAPVTLRELIAQINPVIRGWGSYYRKAHARRLFNRLDRWIERRLYSFLAKRWRNGMWRRYPTKRLIEEFGLVRLTHLIPGLVTR